MDRLRWKPADPQFRPWEVLENGHGSAESSADLSNGLDVSGVLFMGSMCEIDPSNIHAGPD